MRQVRKEWDQELFDRLVVFTDKKKIMDKMGSMDVKDKTLEVNKTYALTKDLFGVKIENGTFRIVLVTPDDALNLYRDFVSVSVSSEGPVFEVKNNLEALLEVTEKYGLEKPDLSAVQGYILNNELVRFQQGDVSTLIFKYKDKPENIFYIYKFYFYRQGKNLLLIIEKNI